MEPENCGESIAMNLYYRDGEYWRSKFVEPKIESLLRNTLTS